MAVMDYSLVQRIIDGTGQILDTTPGSPDSGSYVTEAQLRDWIKAGILFSGYYYNGNFYSDSGHTSPLSKVEGALYVDKTNANKALYVCLSSTYQSLTEEAQVQAIIDGLNDGTIVPLKAKQDQNGNVIDTTYETKADANDLKNALQATNARVENLEEAQGGYYEVTAKSPYTIPSGKAKNWSVNVLRGVTRAKNQLAQVILSTETVNGVTFTNNGDGSVTINGTATADIVKYVTGAITGTQNHYVLFGMLGLSQAISGFSLRDQYTFAATDTAVVWYNTLSNTNAFAFVVANGTVINNVKVYPILRDLTLYFNGNIPSDAQTIADIQTNYPELLVPSDYGSSLVSTTYGGVKSVWANRWDGLFEQNTYWNANGAKVSTPNYDCCKNPIPVMPSTTYFYFADSSGSYANDIYYYWLDINGNPTSSSPYNIPNGSNFTSPANASYLVFYTHFQSHFGANPKIIIGLNSLTDKSYRPYMTDTLSLPTPITLRSAGTVAEEFDLESGEKTNPLVNTALDNKTWMRRDDGLFYTSTAIFPEAKNGSSNVLCDRLLPCPANQTGTSTPEGCISVGSGGYIYAKKASISSVADFVTYLQGSVLYSEATTPNAPTQLDPIQNPYLATEPGGTISSILTDAVDDSMTLGYINL